MSARKSTASDQFAIAPVLRRPAAELGPRARRTIDRILEATRQVFLDQGYGGTSIDDIAQQAGVSRASFYTYFPTKRDALLALGSDASRGAEVLIADLAALGRSPTPGSLRLWVGAYLAFLDDYGSFVLAWAQAAHEDDELRAAGTKGHLRTCRHLGEALESLRGSPLGDPTSQGLLVFSMLERAWAQCRLYDGALDREEVRDAAALVIGATVGAAPDGS